MQRRLLVRLLAALATLALTTCSAGPGQPASRTPAAEATAGPVSAAARPTSTLATEGQRTSAPAGTKAQPGLSLAPVLDSATLVMVMNLDDVVTLDPALAYEMTNPMIHAATYDTLVEFLPGDLTKVSPRLADTWEISSDGTVYTFHLHPGARFASGNPVTAEDVRFSWMRLKNLRGNPSFYADLISDVQAVDPATVKVTLIQPSPAFINIAAAQALSVTDSKVVEEHGGTDAADVAKTDTARDWLDKNSAGSGPYILTGWTRNAQIVLEANPNYWRGRPAISKVIIRHVPDSSLQLQMLQRGEADLVQDLDPDLVEEAKAGPNLDLVVGQTLDQDYLAMTSSAELSKPLADKRVRQAIGLSIDYNGLIKAILRGYATRAASIIPVGILGVDASDVPPRNLDKARALLREAGYENGFTVDLAYGANPTREAIAVKIKNDLAQIHITVNLKPLEQSVYLSEMRAKKLAMGVGFWTPDYLDPTMWTDYFSYGDRGIATRMLYKNPEAERLARIIDTEMDQAKREQAIKDLQKVLMDDMAFTMLYQSQQPIAMTKALKGFQYHPVHFVNFADLSK